MAGASSTPLIHFEKLDINRVQLTDPVLTDKKPPQKTAYIKYDEKRLMFQTPNCTFPFGISSFQNDPANGRSLAVTLDNAVFREKMEALDAKVFEYVKKHSEFFFEEELDDKLLKRFHKPIVKWSKSDKYPRDKYPPSLRIKITDSVKYCDADKQPVDRSYVSKQSSGLAMVQVEALYIMDNSFGVALYAHNIKVQDQPREDFGFLGGEDGQADGTAPDWD